MDTNEFVSHLFFGHVHYDQPIYSYLFLFLLVFFLPESETGISFANTFSLSWTEGLSPNTKRYGKLFTKGVNLF